MLPYRIEKQEKTHRALRKEKPPSSLMLPLSWLGGRLAVTHSSLFIKGILSKRDAGGICHPSCAHAWTHPAQGKSICIDMTSSIVLSSVLYQESCVVSPKGYFKEIGQCVRNKCHTRSVTSA